MATPHIADPSGPNVTILTITPAHNAFVYLETNKPETIPIVCWALCRVDTYDEIKGVIVGDNGKLIFADAHPRFKKYGMDGRKQN